MLGEVLNELSVIVKCERIGAAPSSKKPMIDQDRSVSVQYCLYRIELLGRYDFLSIDRPLIGVNPATLFEPNFSHRFLPNFLVGRKNAPAVIQHKKTMF